MLDVKMPEPSFTAPYVSETRTFRFKLRVTDKKGADGVPAYRRRHRRALVRLLKKVPNFVLGSNQSSMYQRLRLRFLLACGLVG